MSEGHWRVEGRHLPALCRESSVVTPGSVLGDHSRLALAPGTLQDTGDACKANVLTAVLPLRLGSPFSVWKINHYLN